MGSWEKDPARLKIKGINECDGVPQTTSATVSLTWESTEASPNYNPLRPLYKPGDVLWVRHGNVFENISFDLRVNAAVLTVLILVKLLKRDHIMIFAYITEVLGFEKRDFNGFENSLWVFFWTLFKSHKMLTFQIFFFHPCGYRIYISLHLDPIWPTKVLVGRGKTLAVSLSGSLFWPFLPLYTIAWPHVTFS